MSLFFFWYRKIPLRKSMLFFNIKIQKLFKQTLNIKIYGIIKNSMDNEYCLSEYTRICVITY